MARTEFDEAVQRAKDEGWFKGVKDSPTPMTLTIKRCFSKNAVKCDESNCVVARGIKYSQPRVVAASVGISITKILYEDGWVYRWKTNPIVSACVQAWDKPGQVEWNLKPKAYTFSKISGGGKLVGSMTEEEKQAYKKRWRETQKRIRDKISKGTGKKRHRNIPMPARSITIIRGEK